MNKNSCKMYTKICSMFIFAFFYKTNFKLSALLFFLGYTVRWIKGSGKIIGGRDAIDREFPYVVDIELGTILEMDQFCVGSVLNVCSVLTAGHCLFEHDNETNEYSPVVPREIIIIAGSIRRMPMFGQTIRYGSRYIVHPSFEREQELIVHDIGIILFDEPLVMSSYISRVRFLTFEQYNYYVEWKKICRERKKTSLALGWGFHLYTWNPETHEYDYHTPSDTLKVIDTYPISEEGCERELTDYLRDFYEDEDMDVPQYARMSDKGIGCTKAVLNETGVCNGDSGSPLLIDGIIYGVLSTSMDCGMNPPQFPIMYTMLSRSLNFVLPFVRQISSGFSFEPNFIKVFIPGLVHLL